MFGSTLAAETENDWEFKWIPGGLILTFPAERARRKLSLCSNMGSIASSTRR
jgi:hypothetical protein